MQINASVEINTSNPVGDVQVDPLPPDANLVGDLTKVARQRATESGDATDTASGKASNTRSR